MPLLSTRTLRFLAATLSARLQPTPLELLFLIAVIAAIVLGIATGAGVGRFLLTVVGLVTALFIAAFVLVTLGLDRRLARGFVGVILSCAVYGGLHPLFEGMGGRTIDEALLAIEEAWFGTTLVAVVAPYTTPFGMLVFGIVYGWHALLFFAPAALHWRARRPQRAERLLVTLALSMYVGFIGYVLFPAYGPVGLVDGPWLSTGNAATEFVAIYGVDLGTFPSLHAAISAAVAIDGWRTSPRWGVLTTLVAAAIWSSTIYLGYHWAPDLVAGLVLAAFCSWFAGRLLEGWRLHWPALGRLMGIPRRRILIFSEE